MRPKTQIEPKRIARCQAFGFLAGLCVLAGTVRADWPTFRHDPQRSGYTAEALPAQLTLRWSYRATQPPQPAWPRSERMKFDRAFQPVAAAGVVCFGSSGDDQIHALDTATGNERWTFHTDAPVRFAPVLASGRCYAVSDDGQAYCLDAGTGQLLWQHRGAPNQEMVLGNGPMISRWPARGGLVLVDGSVYYSAGIWPSDGIYLYALDATSGQEQWMNDTTGGLYMAQPHGGANAHSGISPQGYLAAAGDHLLVPNGRAVPAAIDRLAGKFEYFHLQANGHRGGSRNLMADQFFVNDDVVYDQKTGTAVNRLGVGITAALPDGLLQATVSNLVVYRWTNQERVDRRGKKQPFRGPVEVERVAHVPAEAAVELIVAGDQAILGMTNRVSQISLPTSNEVWSVNVEGAAYGLAAADGCLYVSTDQGQLYCFAAKGEESRAIRPALRSDPYGNNEFAQRAAEAIVKQTGLRNGYCLDLGCGDGALAYALAQRTQLQILAVDDDPQNVTTARARLQQAGLDGARVTVLCRNPADTGLPNYFANLIVSSRSLHEGASVVPPKEAIRLQRPYGGVVCLGRPGAMQVNVRGSLIGAGNWTHQYCDPANTLCSTDQLVKGPLGMLWFADVDQRLVQRHGRPPAPLFNNGILYSEGLDTLIAVDAYNGHTLWTYPLPGILAAYNGDHLMGTSGSGSNFCLSDDGVYVRRGDHCLRLDARTGKLLGTFTAPAPRNGKPVKWGYIAYENGVLYGSLANPEHVVTYRYLKGGDLAGQLTESDTLFALNATSGQLKWRYDAEHSIRHNAIAIGAGEVVLIDRPLALYDRKRGAKPTNDVSGELVALATQTGEVLWRNTNDIYGTVCLLSTEHNKLVMSFQPTRFRLASELGGRLTCFDLSTGERTWERQASYTSRPMINGQTIYAEGGAWDLLTGEERAFDFQRSYGCGILASAKDLLVFRSATLGYFDLTCDLGTEEFGGMRPGCWINVLPVGGLVLAPDASAGCVCSYPNQAWVALQPDGVRPPVIDPPGETSRQPLTVALRANQPDTEQIRYTLDGTLPTANSARYKHPLPLTNSVSLSARSFGPNHRASRVATARFTIDPNVLSLAPASWRVWDAPKASPASQWRLTSGQFNQRANTLVNLGQAMSKAPGAERPGTFDIYQEGFQFRDGELTFEIQSTDNDTVGVAFRLTDAAHCYLWLMDSERGFRALTAKQGTNYTLLATSSNGYEPGKWYDVRIVLEGPRVTVYVDGEQDVEATDAQFQAGTVALYSWGNSGVSFRNLRFKPTDQPASAERTRK